MTAADWLRAAQADAWAALDSAPCFLRRDARDDALFVSDLPRHADAASVEAARGTLVARGFHAWVEDELLRVDASLPRYEELLLGLPNQQPPFPEDDALHPAYALCRLWLRAAPAPLGRQPLEPLRCVLKRLGNTQELNKRLPRLHGESAALLRAHAPLPHAAGRVLADWIQRRTP